MSTTAHAHPERLRAKASARHRLSNIAFVIIAFNVLATILAIVLDLPSLFDPPAQPDPIETDWIARGTAISAPLPPIALLAACALLLRRHDRWAIAGLIGIGLLSTLFLIGAVGELTAQPAGNVTRAVLTGAGIAWGAIALSLIALAINAARQPR